MQHATCEHETVVIKSELTCLNMSFPGRGSTNANSRSNQLIGVIHDLIRQGQLQIQPNTTDGDFLRNPTVAGFNLGQTQKRKAIRQAIQNWLNNVGGCATGGGKLKVNSKQSPITCNSVWFLTCCNVSMLPLVAGVAAAVTTQVAPVVNLPPELHDDLAAQTIASAALAPKRRRVSDSIDLADDTDDDDDVYYGGTLSTGRKETEWQPAYFLGEWKEADTPRKRISIVIQLLCGNTDDENLQVSVTDDGMQLVVKSRIPDIMMEKGLHRLHMDEESEMTQTDFHNRKSAMCAAVEAFMRKSVGPTSDRFWFLSRIPLKFPCEKTFDVRNKGDSSGVRLLYITLKEKGDEVTKIGNSWIINDYLDGKPKTVK